ncbi:hypothetical protein ACFL67_01785 [candidate division KSB1 bacterium]
MKRSHIHTLFGFPLAALTFIALHCGDSPQEVPAIRTGDLAVVALFNNIETDSLEIIFDDISVGKFSNPHTLYNISAGAHKVNAMSGDLIGEPVLTYIEENELNSVGIVLSGTGPYEGYTAPDFTVNDISGRQFSLGDHRGKIVFLFFFEHT